jgi:hypothetical protein
MLTAWIFRSLLLLASAVAIAAAAILGPDNDGDTAFRLLLIGIALYVVSRILDKR